MRRTVTGCFVLTSFQAIAEARKIYCRKETLTGLLIRSVQYGGGAEACLAARCLGLLSITLGAGDDSEK